MRAPLSASLLSVLLGAARAAEPPATPPADVLVDASTSRVTLAWEGGETLEVPFTAIERFEMAPEVGDVTAVLLLRRDDGRTWVVGRGEKGRHARFIATTIARRPLALCEAADCGAGADGPAPRLRVQTLSLDLDLPSPVSAGALGSTRRLPGDVTGAPIVQVPAAEVDKVVKTRIDDILACYRRELSRRPSLGGEVVVEMMIDAQGKVTEARVKSTSLGSRPVEDCVVGVYRQLVFPAPKQGTFAIISHSVKFAK